MFAEYLKKLSKNYSFEKQKIKQNDPRLDYHIRMWGCFFRSLCGIAETYLEKLLTVNQINYLYAECKGNSAIMNDNCFMGVQQTAVVEYASRELGHEIRCDKRGYFVNGQYQFVDDLHVFTDCVLNWKTKSGAHFTQGDGKLREIFDPWQGKISKLYITKIGLYNIRA